MLRSGSHQDGVGTNKNACEGVAGALCTGLSVRDVHE